jgi:hypothetical protein
MLGEMKEHWDLIKILATCALSAGGAAAGGAKLVAQAEVAVVAARVDEHLRPGVIHEESARRIGEAAGALDSQLHAVDAKAEAAARDAYASRIMLEALLAERGIQVPRDALRPPPGGPARIHDAPSPGSP